MLRRRLLWVSVAMIVANLAGSLDGAPTAPVTTTQDSLTLFSWPKDTSEIFSRISALPREDVVAKIRAVVEPVTKDTLTQLTPDFLRSLSEKPKEKVVAYVSEVIPEPKDVVSHVHAILSPAGDLLSPAAKGVGELLADLSGRNAGNSSGTQIGGPKSAIRAAATAASNRAIRLGVDAARTIMSIAFEPLTVAHLVLVIDEPQLKGKLRLDDLEINNVSTFILRSIESDPASMKANFSATLDAFNVTGHYDIDCDVGAEKHKLFGAGNFSVTVKDLKVDGALTMSIKNLFLHVDDLQLAVGMDSLKVQLQRLLGDDAIAGLASGVISDVGPHFLDEFRPEVGSILSAQVAAHTNGLLALFSIPVILETLQSRGEDVIAARSTPAPTSPHDIAEPVKDKVPAKIKVGEPSLSLSDSTKEVEVLEKELETYPNDDLRRIWDLEFKKHALWLEQQARRKEELSST